MFHLTLLWYSYPRNDSYNSVIHWQVQVNNPSYKYSNLALYNGFYKSKHVATRQYIPSNNHSWDGLLFTRRKYILFTCGGSPPALTIQEALAVSFCSFPRKFTVFSVPLMMTEVFKTRRFHILCVTTMVLSTGKYLLTFAKTPRSVLLIYWRSSYWRRTHNTLSKFPSQFASRRNITSKGSDEFVVTRMSETQILVMFVDRWNAFSVKRFNSTSAEALAANCDKFRGTKE